MTQYGSDKPDLRFGLEIQDGDRRHTRLRFGVFDNAATVRYLVAPKAFSRSELGRLEELAKEWGAKGLAYLVFDGRRGALADREVPLASASSTRSAPTTARRSSSAPATTRAVLRVLGLLRLHLGARARPCRRGPRRLPLGGRLPALRAGQDDGRVDVLASPLHRTRTTDETWDEANPAGVHGQHYDLVWNGWELGSGSIRIHDVEVQQRVFRTMGMSEEEAQSKFGFLLDALAMGAPPHGGFAMGIERFVALLAGEPDIRQIVAFPKVSSGFDPLTGAPTPMPAEVLAESGIAALSREPER